MPDDVDEALEETFPASDPPANTVETGIVPTEVAEETEGTETEVTEERGRNEGTK
jgi:hypothetical protein